MSQTKAQLVSGLSINASAPATAFNIDSSGRCGIGTTSPQKRLHVVGDDGAVSSFPTIGGKDFLILENNGNCNLSLIAGATSGCTLKFFASGSSEPAGSILSDHGNNYLGLAHTSSLSFSTAGTERARIDSSGRLLVGTSSAFSQYSAGFQLVNNSGSGIDCGRFDNSASSSDVILTKGRGGSVGTRGIVSNNDQLGQIGFKGDDGSTLNSYAAAITALVDGTPGTNDMPGRLVFSTTADGASSPTERLRIGSSGTTASTTASTNFLCINTGANGTALIYFQTASAELGKIRINGAGVAYDTTSDYRLKENVEPITGAIDRVQALKPWRFNFISHPEVTVDGFLAHEAQEVVPEAVGGTKDEVDADGKPVYQGIDQSKLVPLLTAALQETIAELQALKAEVASLKAS
jgi:hypothetical protein